MIVTLATIPAIVALVTLAKDLGLPSRLGPLVALVFGVALSLLEALTLNSGQLSAWYEPVAQGVILGLSASGLYDGARVISEKKEYRGRHATPEEEEDTSQGTLF